MGEPCGVDTGRFTTDTLGDGGEERLSPSGSEVGRRFVSKSETTSSPETLSREPKPVESDSWVQTGRPCVEEKEPRGNEPDPTPLGGREEGSTRDETTQRKFLRGVRRDRGLCPPTYFLVRSTDGRSVCPSTDVDVSLIPRTGIDNRFCCLLRGEVSDDTKISFGFILELSQSQESPLFPT